MPKDLRTFMELVERKDPSGFRRVSREVDPEYESSAILRKFQHRGEYPLVYFEEVRGSDFPIVSNVIADNTKLALTLDVPEENLLKSFVEREAHPIPPKHVKDGPVKGKVYTGKEVDLNILPWPVQCEKDGGGLSHGGRHDRPRPRTPDRSIRGSTDRCSMSGTLWG